MANKRKQKRRHLIYYLKVVEKETNNPMGYLVDITTEGIMLMSEIAVETGQIFELKILLQTEMSRREYLVFKAESVWCKKSVNSDLYDTGYRLLNVTPHDFKGIEEIIKELGFAN